MSVQSKMMLYGEIEVSLKSLPLQGMTAQPLQSLFVGKVMKASSNLVAITARLGVAPQLVNLEGMTTKPRADLAHIDKVTMDSSAE